MAFLTIFRNSFASGLLSGVPGNLDKYRRDDKWALELGVPSKRDLETRFEVRSVLELDEPDDGNLKDLENAIRVHKALGRLTPLQARDPRLWSRLAHVECWEYMRKRWPVERFSADPGKMTRFVVSRYFVPQSDSRALLRNGVARLWWTSHMSFDAMRENPYELTGVLLSTLDITQQLLERNMGRSPAVATGFLEFLLEYKDLLLTGGDRNRARIRRLAKFLNMHGGVCLLDCLTNTDIMKLLGDELERIIETEATKGSTAS